MFVVQSLWLYQPLKHTDIFVCLMLTLWWCVHLYCLSLRWLDSQFCTSVAVPPTRAPATAFLLYFYHILNDSWQNPFKNFSVFKFWPNVLPKFPCMIYVHFVILVYSLCPPRKHVQSYRHHSISTVYT